MNDLVTTINTTCSQPGRVAFCGNNSCPKELRTTRNGIEDKTMQPCKPLQCASNFLLVMALLLACPLFLSAQSSKKNTNPSPPSSPPPKAAAPAPAQKPAQPQKPPAP